jgi:hypothetical protein
MSGRDAKIVVPIVVLIVVDEDRDEDRDEDGEEEINAQRPSGSKLDVG